MFTSLFCHTNHAAHTSTLVGRRHLISICTSLLIALGVSGCFAPNDEPDPPRLAGVQVTHQNLQQGEVEVLFDDVPIMSVSFGATQAAIEIPVAEGKFSFRQAGAPSHFFETEVFNLAQDQVYTFALVSEDINEDLVLNLTAAPPQGEDDIHWVRFVNLSGVDDGVIYRGQAQVETLPLDENPSAFTSVESAAQTQFSISSGMGVPLVILPDVSLPSGGASIFIIGDSPEPDSIELYNLPLDMERLNFSMMDIEE
jgi:hypothetical protein